MNNRLNLFNFFYSNRYTTIKIDKMRRVFISALTIILGIIFSGSIIVAQEQTQSNQLLNEEQKAMIKNDLQKRKEIREAFKATLTQDQKNMLTDPRMMKTDRLKAFKASLTDQQVNIIKARQQGIKATRGQLWSTMSNQQKMQFKKMTANRSLMNRTTLKRAIWRHRLGRI